MSFTNLTFFVLSWTPRGFTLPQIGCHCCQLYNIETAVYVDQALINLANILDGSILVVTQNEDEATAFGQIHATCICITLMACFDEVGGGLLQRL